MADRPRFRPERSPPRGAPWSLIAVLILTTGALVGRALWSGEPASSTLVEVRGDVPRPGLYALDAPTIRAAIRAAGGPGDAFPDAPVPHGHRVIVERGQATVGPPADPLLVSLPVDPNTAARHELIALPGVGPATADRILADRTERGPYRRVEDLRRVLKADTLNAVEPFLAIAAVPPIELNTAPAGELETLPGIGPVLAARIVVDRAEGGPYSTVDDLLRVKGVGPELIEGLRSRVQVLTPPGEFP